MATSRATSPTRLMLALAAVVFGVVSAMWPARPPADSSAIGGPFQLTTDEGTRLSDQELRGAPFAVFFGFTNCPEICPTTLWEMSEALKALGSEGRQLRLLFITVDPERDTPAVLSRYLQAFDSRIVGLTGSDTEIEAVAKSYRIYREKVPTDDGNYTMDHTATVMLMGKDGRFRGTIAYEESSGTRLEKLKRLVRE